MTTNKKARIEIQSCTAVEGPLYAVEFEDSIGHCYDWSFEAQGTDGKRYVLRTYRVEGCVRNEEGFLSANYGARSRALGFAARVQERGSIDPALWDEFPEHDAHPSSDLDEARREKKDDLFWEESGRPAHWSVRR